MMNIKDYFKKEARLSVKPKRIDKITFNESDAYVTMDANIDLVHGCAGVDIFADLAADAIADTAADAAADNAVDAGADGGDGSGVPEGSTSATANPGRAAAEVIGAASVSLITAQVTSALERLSSGTTSAEYYTALYNAMIQNYPCNVSAADDCPGTQRDEQEYMIMEFQAQLISSSPSAAQAAQAFYSTWSTSQSEIDLQNSLSEITETAGIPSMIQYMEGYTTPGASGAALVIATINTVLSVANFEFAD